MSLASVKTEELSARLLVLIDEMDELTRTLGPFLEKLGRAKKEIELLSEELRKRDA
jgi:hypothetical protein